MEYNQKGDDFLNKVSFPKIASVIAPIAATIGIITFFVELSNITCICAVIVIIESFIQVVFSNQKGFFSEIAASAIGFIIALIANLDIVSIIAVSLCFENLIMTVAGIIMIVIVMKR